MNEEPRIGVYVCHCGTNIAGVIDVDDVVNYALKLPGVVVAKHYVYLCSAPGQRLIVEDIKKHHLNRVIVAACSPRMHESTFRKTVEEGGLNPYLFVQVNIREHASWVHSKHPKEATEKAKMLIKMAVERAKHLEPLEPLIAHVEKKVLVIGGGIAGIRAALDIANAGYKVYLVEKSPSIGGKMAKLDKTFPTLDCSPCILTPLMVEVSRNPNIVLLTYSEVEEVSGSIGDFKVKIKRKPRYVEEDKCVGCGICIEKCPIKVPSEFYEGLGTRKAIFIPFPQAVPRVPVIDAENCLYFKKDVCRICEKYCPTKAINYNQKPETIEVNVGAIIVATGYDLVDRERLVEYGIGRYVNIITGLQMEAMANPSGPTHGHIVRLSDGKEPKRVVIILCAGSRDENVLKYCCKVGCMNGLKHAWYVKTHVPDAEVYVLYIDLRAGGKGYEEFYRKIRDMGVRFIKGKPSIIYELPDKRILVRVYDGALDEIVEIEADLVVLETGVVPAKGTEELRKKLKIPAGPNGFLMELHPKLNPVETPTDGIYIAGFIHSPKDIPDSVAQASGAAAKAISQVLSRDYLVKEPIVALVDQDSCVGCRICASVCPYGAIDIVNVDGKDKAEINELRCKGCGTCVASCPVGAIDMKHYREKQIVAMVRAL